MHRRTKDGDSQHVRVLERVRDVHAVRHRHEVAICGGLRAGGSGKRAVGSGKRAGGGRWVWGRERGRHCTVSVSVFRSAPASPRRRTCVGVLEDEVLDLVREPVAEEAVHHEAELLERQLLSAATEPPIGRATEHKGQRSAIRGTEREQGEDNVDDVDSAPPRGEGRGAHLVEDGDAADLVGAHRLHHKHRRRRRKASGPHSAVTVFHRIDRSESGLWPVDPDVDLSA